MRLSTIRRLLRLPRLRRHYVAISSSTRSRCPSNALFSPTQQRHMRREVSRNQEMWRLSSARYPEPPDELPEQSDRYLSPEGDAPQTSFAQANDSWLEKCGGACLRSPILNHQSPTPTPVLMRSPTSNASWLKTCGGSCPRSPILSRQNPTPTPVLLRSPTRLRS